MAETANSRVNGLIEKLAIGALGLVLALGQWQYQTDRKEIRDQTKELDMKVLDLYRTSVTKAELKEFEERLTKEMSGIRSDVRGILGIYVEESVRRRTEK